MNRHCMTMTARAELNLWSKYWSRAVVGGGVLHILYCGVYILNCGWPHSSSQYIIGAAYTNPPILTDRVNAYRAPDWALFAKIFTSTLPWMNSVLVVVVSLYLPFSSPELSLGPYLLVGFKVGTIFTLHASPTPVITRSSLLFTSKHSSSPNSVVFSPSRDINHNILYIMKCSAQSVEIVTIYLVNTTISFNPDVVEISLAFVACRVSEMPMIEYITLVPVLSQAPHWLIAGPAVWMPLNRLFLI